MIEIQDKHKCCGCEACVQACPEHCISFNEDTEGFRYPSVNKSACIDCGLCEKVCPVLQQAEQKEPLKVYAAQNTNEEELMASSSGGLFILLAKETLREGGIVFGAKFNEKWEVVHDYAETEEEVRAFMGSKYVQSRIGNTYAQAKKFLKQGRKVLYTGTSCQIAGLKNFLRKDYDNLLTIDVICHGVPSPMVWRRYLEELKRNARKGKNSVSSPLIHSISEGDASNVHIESISFRDKRTGWKKHSFALTLAEASADGKKNTVSLSHIFNEDPYMQLFLRNLILRPSCYQCPAKAGKSQSDLTIADFWGIERCHPDFDDERGVGLMMVNSEKGKQAIQSLPLKLLEVSFEDAIASNPVYKDSVTEPQKRKQCFKDLYLTKKTLSKIVEKIFMPSLEIRIKQKILRILRHIKSIF